MKRVLLAGLFLALSISGGMQFYNNTVVGQAYLLAGVVSLAAAVYFYVRGDRPPMLASALVMWAALGLSTLANLDIWPVAVGRLLQAASAISALALAYRVKAALVKEALHLAGWVWPWLYLILYLAGIYDHHNVLSVWPVFFILIGLSGKKWHYLLPNVAALLWLCSRGAIIGVIIGIVVIIYHHLNLNLKKLSIAALCAAPVACFLFFLRPGSALIRFHYWHNALNSFISYPFLGIGPGGLWARQIIPENDFFVNHAHNPLLTLLAEGGIVGVIGLVLALYILPRINLTRWQWSVLAALMAHSLVDEPLWWIGPLVAAAIIFGSRDV